MAYADTAEAIGEVSDLIRSRLQDLTEVDTIVGRPEPPGDDVTRFTLFLYESELDSNLKNFSPDEDNPPPLWLILKYLLTSFDGGNSDSVNAHRNLSKAIQALQTIGFLPTSSRPALESNPEQLKITFDAISPDLISKIMQGSDEKYRFSMGFQIRPVMVAAREDPSYSQLVGIDYTTAPPKVVGEEKIHIPVLPSMGASITRLEPKKFEANQTLTIYGDSLNLSAMVVRLGAVDIGTTMQKSDRLQCELNGSIAGGAVISAGSHPITIVQELPGGRYRSSNVLMGELLPHVETVATQGSPVVQNGFITGEVKVDGKLLGRKEDDIVLALFAGSQVVKVFEGKTADTAAPAAPDVMFVVAADQSHLILRIRKEDKLPPGKYLTILRINGQQARLSPEVNLVP